LTWRCNQSSHAAERASLDGELDTPEIRSRDDDVIYELSTLGYVRIDVKKGVYENSGPKVARRNRDDELDEITRSRRQPRGLALTMKDDLYKISHAQSPSNVNDEQTCFARG
jgi:hypothetical protein